MRGKHRKGQREREGGNRRGRPRERGTESERERDTVAQSCFMSFQWLVKNYESLSAPGEAG